MEDEPVLEDKEGTVEFLKKLRDNIKKLGYPIDDFSEDLNQLLIHVRKSNISFNPIGKAISYFVGGGKDGLLFDASQFLLDEAMGEITVSYHYLKDEDPVDIDHIISIGRYLNKKSISPIDLGDIRNASEYLSELRIKKSNLEIVGKTQHITLVYGIGSKSDDFNSKELDSKLKGYDKAFSKVGISDNDINILTSLRVSLNKVDKQSPDYNYESHLSIWNNFKEAKRVVKEKYISQIIASTPPQTFIFNVHGTKKGFQIGFGIKLNDLDMIRIITERTRNFPADISKEFIVFSSCKIVNFIKDQVLKKIQNQENMPNVITPTEYGQFTVGESFGVSGIDIFNAIMPNDSYNSLGDTIDSDRQNHQRNFSIFTNGNGEYLQIY